MEGSFYLRNPCAEFEENRKFCPKWCYQVEWNVPKVEGKNLGGGRDKSQQRKGAYYLPIIICPCIPFPIFFTFCPKLYWILRYQQFFFRNLFPHHIHINSNSPSKPCPKQLSPPPLRLCSKQRWLSWGLQGVGYNNPPPSEFFYGGMNFIEGVDSKITWKWPDLIPFFCLYAPKAD